MSTSCEQIAFLPEGVVLHARPASELARLAMSFQSPIRIHHEGREADARSLFALLALGTAAGGELRVVAVGPDAQTACGEICAAIQMLQ